MRPISLDARRPRWEAGSGALNQRLAVPGAGPRVRGSRLIWGVRTTTRSHAALAAEISAINNSGERPRLDARTFAGERKGSLLKNTRATETGANVVSFQLVDRAGPYPLPGDCAGLRKVHQVAGSADEN